MILQMYWTIYNHRIATECNIHILYNNSMGYGITSLLINVYIQCYKCNIQGVSRLVDITAGGDFLGHCDQKCSYKHVSDFGRLRSYGHFLIPVHALVWTACYESSWNAGKVGRVGIRLASIYCMAQLLLRIQQSACAVYNRAAACVAAGSGIFENQL
jgi:hypothetical protein